jgi:hypothetical protein
LRLVALACPFGAKGSKAPQQFEKYAALPLDFANGVDISANAANIQFTRVSHGFDGNKLDNDPCGVKKGYQVQLAHFPSSTLLRLPFLGA